MNHIYNKNHSHLSPGSSFRWPQGTGHRKGIVAATEFALQQQIEDLYADHHGWLQGWLRRKLGDSFVAAPLLREV